MKCDAYPRLKILHLVSGDLWAGAETMSLNLLRRLMNYDDLDITVILFNEGRLSDELRSLGIPIHVINESLYSFWGLLQQTQKIIGCNYPDIIHSHRYKENMLAFLISCRSRTLKLVSTQHGLPEVANKRPSLAARFKSKTNFFLLSRHFAKTVAVSKDIRNVLIGRFGFRKEKIEVIHNGIELPATSSDSGEKAGPFVIGSSGRLFPVKDYPFMIEIARTIAATGAGDIRFELAGAGPELPVLESLVQHSGLNSKFIFKGHQDDMDSFYRGLDIYLNTSVHEGIPMTILEALGYGHPVIAPSVGGIVEIIDDGINGFLIDSRSPHDFAAKCLLLREDRELRERMSKAAREKAERAFSAEMMAEKYYRLYCTTALQGQLRCVR